MTRIALLLCLAALAWPAFASAQCDCPVEGSLVIGHRGAGTNDASEALPENTIESAQAAFAEGADMVEIDVQLTSDGTLVLMHDDTVDRTTDGTGCVTGMTLAEVRALDVDGVSVPTLDELFAAVTGAVNVEVKIHETDACPAQDLDATADAVIASITTNAGSRDIIVSSFDLPVLQRIRAADPTIAIGYLATGAGDIAVTAEEGFEAIHLLIAVANVRTVRQAHEAGLLMNVFTLSGTVEITEALELGVDGVITDTAAEGVMARTAFCDSYVCPMDAGPPPGLDAGTGGDDGGGCHVAPGRHLALGGTGLPWLALMALAALALPARGRRRSHGRSGRART